jgi:hypothetical protein
MVRSVQDPAHKALRILATLFASTPPPMRSTAPHQHHEFRKVQRPPRDAMLCGRKDTPLRSIGGPAAGGARPASQASGAGVGGAAGVVGDERADCPWRKVVAIEGATSRAAGRRARGMRRGTARGGRARARQPGGAPAARAADSRSCQRCLNRGPGPPGGGQRASRPRRDGGRRQQRRPLRRVRDRDHHRTVLLTRSGAAPGAAGLLSGWASSGSTGAVSRPPPTAPWT